MSDLVIAVDFDNTIAEEDEVGRLVPVAGVREALQALREQGAIIVIHTCRVKLSREKRQLTQEMYKLEKWLDDYQIPFDQIDMGDKPVARFYIDDRAVHFNGDWDQVTRVIENRMREEGEDIDGGTQIKAIKTGKG
jgi:predicted phosphatase